MVGTNSFDQNELPTKIQSGELLSDDPSIILQSINQSFFPGLAFAVNGVELLHLNNVVTGCILLGGLFFYDIFWVFGTDVMVTVAKSFEAPIKLVFPQVQHI